MTREDRDEEIADQVAYLDELVRALRRECPTNATLHVLGFSQGVATATRWAYRTSTPLKQIVLWGGSIPAYFTGACPARVHRLALLEGVGPPEDETPNPTRVASWIRAWKRTREAEPRAYPSIDAAAARLRAADPRLSDEHARVFAERGTVELPDGSRRFKHDPLHVTRGPYPFRIDVAAPQGNPPPSPAQPRSGGA